MEEVAVKSRLVEIFHAAEAKDIPRLDSYHAYDRHFTKFGPGPTARMEAAAAREGEHTGLRAVAGLKLRAEDVQVDVFGDTAVATMLITASFQSGVERVTKQDRATLVFIKAGGSWKIVHEHISAGP